MKTPTTETLVAQPGDRKHIRAAYVEFIERSGIAPTEDIAAAFIMATLRLLIVARRPATPTSGVRA